MGNRANLAECIGAGDNRGLGPICATLAQARRNIADGRDVPLTPLRERLAAILTEPSHRQEDAAMLALLDELAGLVGQLEFEREDARSRLAAFERHRCAQQSYGRGKGRA
jgi:hypothetical protein